MSRLAKAVLFAAAVVAVLLPVLGRADDEKADLRLRFEQGKTYRLTVTVEQRIRQLVQAGGAPGEEQDIAQTVKIGQAFEVNDVNDAGVATIKVTFGPLAMRTEMAGFAIEYDSDKPPDELYPAARPLAAMVGQSFTMVVKPDGTVERLEGVDAMLEAARDALELPDEKRTLLAEELERQFGEKALKEMMTGVLDYVPDRPVGVGDTWSRTLAVESGFPATFETADTLLARKDGVATIEAKTKITPNADAPPQKLGAATVRYKLEGTQEGTLEIDEATGWYVKATLTQKVKGEMFVSGLPDQAEGEELSVPIIIESSITIGTQ